MKLLRILFVLSLLVATMFSGCVQQQHTYQPVPKPTPKPCIRVANDYYEDGYEGLDYVLYVFVTVSNNCDPGSATVYCRITQSGNEYLRCETVYLDTGQHRDLRFRFNEISFWGSGGHYKVWVE